MLARLPEPIREEVILHLHHDNFVMAKRLYDAWKTVEMEASNSELIAFTPALEASINLE